MRPALDLTAVPHLLTFPPGGPQTQREGEFVDASAWLGRGSERPAMVVLGVPFAGGSISKGRMDLAPGAIRGALARFSAWSSDWDVDLMAMEALDAGDVDPARTVEGTQERVAAVMGAIAGSTDSPSLIIGGDNSITVGAVLGSGADALLTFDAHHDCRDPSRGASNGTPVRQLVRDGFGPVFQVGIHGFANAAAHAKWARDHGVRWASAASVSASGMDMTLNDALGEHLKGAGRIWVDFDIDVLDRAFAPGAPAAMPGGLVPADLCDAAFRLGKDPRVCGADIVEVDPRSDVASITVRAACAVLLSFACGVASR